MSDNNKDRVLTYRFSVILILLVAFALRVINLATRSLWFDESMEYWVATSSLSQILPNVKQALQDPPLYSILLHFWLAIGHHEFSVRFLSLVFSLLGITAVILFSRLAFGKRASVAAGLLAALSVPDIRFAQEAGQYALMVFILSWNLLFLFLFIKRRNWKWGILWGLSSVLGIYSYYGTALTIIATSSISIVYIISKQQWKFLQKWAVVGICCMLLLLPLLLHWLPSQFFRGPTSTAFNFSLSSYERELERLFNDIRRFLLFQAMGYRFNDWPWPSIPSWTIWLSMILLLLFSIKRRNFRLPFLWFVGTLLVHYIAGRLKAFPFSTRYTMILAPLLWICMSAGATKLNSIKKYWTVPVFAWILLINVFTPIESQEDLRSVTQIWLAHRQPTDKTYVYYGAVPGFRYQIGLTDFENVEDLPPLWYMDCWRGNESTAYCSSNGVSYGRWIRRKTPDEKKASIMETLERAPERLWVVSSHIHEDEDQIIVDSLKDIYQINENHQAENSSLFLLERK